MSRLSNPVIIAAVVLMLTLVGAAVWYVGARISKFLKIVIPGMNAKVFTGLCVLFFLTFIVSMLPLSVNIKKPAVWFASLLAGVFVYYLIYFLLADVLILMGRLINAVPTPVPNTVTLYAGAIVTALVLFTAVYGVYNAGQIKKAQYTVTINKETTEDALRIALISDTHIGYLNDEKRLARVINEINAVNPDIVCIAGDIFNDNFDAVGDKAEISKLLNSIVSKYGVYACFGNHDGGRTFYEMRMFLKDSGVIVLEDEFTEIEGLFVIAGRTEANPIGRQDKPRKEWSAIKDGINSDLPVIVIDHNPANIIEYGDETDIILAGHTHKGQMFPCGIVTNLMYTVHYGHYQKETDSPHVIVTSGAGVWGPPFRFGSDSEVVSVLAEFQ